MTGTTEIQRESIRRAWGQAPLATHVARCSACGRSYGAMPTAKGFRLNKHGASGLPCRGGGEIVAEVIPL